MTEIIESKQAKQIQAGKRLREANEAKYYAQPKHCKHCDGILTYDQRSQLFCSVKCADLSKVGKRFKISKSIIEARRSQPPITKIDSKFEAEVREDFRFKSRIKIINRSKNNINITTVLMADTTNSVPKDLDMPFIFPGLPKDGYKKQWYE